jgi:hypothetical protein
MSWDDDDPAWVEDEQLDPLWIGDESFEEFLEGFHGMEEPLPEMEEWLRERGEWPAERDELGTEPLLVYVERLVADLRVAANAIEAEIESLHTRDNSSAVASVAQLRESSRTRRIMPTVQRSC